MNSLFKRTDILIPASGVDNEKWSVIACDQHSSEPEYWDALDTFIGDAPSTLRLMLPEAYLDRDIDAETEKINKCMHEYLERGVFAELKDSYVYIERTLPSGVVRKGLVGAINLDEYDYTKGSCSMIRATEGTVESRLPARVRIRSGAELEMPHVMVFFDDPGNKVFDSLKKDSLIYDFELNAGGGHLSGWRIHGEQADIADAALLSLSDDANVRFAGKAPAVFAIGDGNHSLATAKKCGDHEALVELVNIEDESITFEPIHRVLFNTDTEEFEKQFGAKISRVQSDDNYAKLVSDTEAFCVDYITRHGGSIDYIHNDETAIEMGNRENCAAILLPALDKTKLFDCIVNNGSFPKKSFSIGHACDKRYYMECRKIK